MHSYPRAAVERMMKVQEVILRAMAKKITWWQAAEIIGMSDRQMRRWHWRYREHGYDELLDRRVGKPSPKRVPLAVVEQVLGLYQEKYFDLNVRHFHEKLKQEHQIQLSYTWVKKAVARSGVLYHCPLFHCIYAEITANDHTFSLNNGKWYRISQDFARSVEQSYEQLDTSTLVLPDYHDGSETEYNARVATEDRTRLALMDSKLIEYPGMASKVEFCDLYSRARQIIHVKRYRGSSVSSHLFAQGLVSGELFRRDEEFRRLVNAKLPRSHRLGASVGRIDAAR